MNASHVPLFVLSFKESISLLGEPGGEYFLDSPFTKMSLSRVQKGFLAALHLLSSGGATVEELIDVVIQHDGELGMPTFFYYLQHFTKRGLICHTVTCNEIKLATIVPISPNYQFRLGELVVNEQYMLSRFAYLRSSGQQFLLECPLAHAKILLHDQRTMALLHTLSKPCHLADLYRDSGGLSAESVAGFLTLLLACKSLCVVSSDKSITRQQQTAQEALDQWQFHDLLFHSKSRRGRQDSFYGATYRFRATLTWRGQIDPLPAVKAPMSNETISLYKPDIETLKQNDLPFTRVLEERVSIRKHGEQPITAQQLGEFLYRTARLKTLSQAEQAPYQFSQRPYPSGGACYELEVYLVINACEGLPAGLYHYCPQTHQLYKVAGRTSHVEALLHDAYYSAGKQGWPQVLIVLAARFQRVAWKYESLAYAMILKHVGVLYQTMYLVATAMGLASCALGGGNADLFATAVGTNYYAETSVGEFILGSIA